MNTWKQVYIYRLFFYNFRILIKYCPSFFLFLEPELDEEELERRREAKEKEWIEGPEVIHLKFN